MPTQRISEIVAGKRAVTADTDLRLCRFFTLSNGYWLRAQAAYDTEVAQIEAHPNPGYCFSHWGGDVPNKTVNPTTLTMSSDRSVKAVFKECKVLVVALSGEQFFPGISGVGSCILDWAGALPTVFFDRMLRDEEDVYPDGSGPVYDEILYRVAEGSTKRIAIVGHSHGGGSAWVLCNRLTANHVPVEIVMTGYIDGIRDDQGEDQTDPVTQYPTGSEHNVNIYQSITSIFLPVGEYGESIEIPVNGSPVPGSEPNNDINSLPCVDGVSHTQIDDNPIVHRTLTNSLEGYICPVGIVQIGWGSVCFSFGY